MGYLAGSIPWGLLIARRASGADIRRLGSGNIGATNVRRVAGNLPGALTLAGDLLKGAVPVWLAIYRVPDPGSLAALVALAAFLGHLYPVYLGFCGGGKGVATAAGCFVVLSPAALGASLLVFVLVLWSTARVSAASLAAAASLPAAVWVATGSGMLTSLAVVIGFLIGWRHRANLARMMAGTEPRAW
jgi:glycerol-3-phosphate acyltransferase PlsY